jgi:hypothetical protein
MAESPDLVISAIDGSFFDSRADRLRVHSQETAWAMPPERCAVTTPRPACSICGKRCDELEPAFRRPDAVFAVPEQERDRRVRQSDDFVSIDDEAFFIRGVVPIPVEDLDHPYCWGFWVKVARKHFEEYQRFFNVDPPRDHPGFEGTLANQTRHLAPTLGSPVNVGLQSGRHRPVIMLLDESHTLAQDQARGVTRSRVHTWSTLFQGREDPLQPTPDPPAPLFTTTLEEDGWLVAEPRQVGRTVEQIGIPPRPGDLVKVAFVYQAADEHGNVVQRIELMWVLLDEVREDGWWSGTVNNFPFVPGPIDGGSRVWLRAEHVIRLERGEPRSRATAAGQVTRTARSRIADRIVRWWRGLLGPRGRDRA